MHLADKQITLGNEIDTAYTTRLKDLLLEPGILQKGASLKIVFSALHGTGGVYCRVGRANPSSLRGPRVGRR